MALCGTLGAGKTRLVQAIADAVGIDRRNVTSPTFVLVQEYRPPGRLSLRRLSRSRQEEFWELGPEEYFEGDGLMLVEWADRVEIASRGARRDSH